MARIVDAEMAGRGTVADVLASKLDALRAAKAALAKSNNVVLLAAKRRGGP
jgi:hypothetical protein